MMKRSILVLGLLYCAATTNAQAESAANDLINAGEKLAGSGQWAAAKAKFEEAVAADAANAVAYYDLGVAYAHLGQMPQAATSERKALEVNPKLIAAHIELGWIQCQMKEFDAASESIKKALALDPTNKLALKNMEGINAARARAEKKLAPQVVAPPSVATLMDTGISAFKKGDLQSAKLQFEQAVVVDSNNAQAHANLGVVLGTLGNVDQQAVEERRATQLDAKNAQAWTNLGWAESKRLHWNDALNAYQKALALNPNLSEAQCGQAIALFHLGKQEAGIAAIKLAIKAAPNAAQPKIAYASLLQASSRFQEAESELREALKLSPNNSEAKRYLAAVLKSKTDTTK